MISQEHLNSAQSVEELSALLCVGKVFKQCSVFIPAAFHKRVTSSMEVSHKGLFQTCQRLPCDHSKKLLHGPKPAEEHLCLLKVERGTLHGEAENN